ncbi:PQQ-binding-like beta-propeller repeat protein [Amaricoccus sp.]|uniref:outer membrane protein assembly factor BamB family protein n=1 Tax=Amaricoccus sp. TaxID=1872485 RepID=UPI002618AED6|nr:PQQ-binding-like beta-propeller repeat protein [Amaricoccus sp.]HRO11107.1 PQQ-binding-like beta-propeller repeat protein [Amaricoccus sp.]
MSPRPSLGLALALSVALAGCAARDPILPGERIPVRAEDAPIAGGSRTALGLPAPVMNAEWTHRNGAARGRLVNPALRPVPQLVWSVDIGQGDAKRRRLITGPIVAGGLVFTLDAAGQVTAVTRSGQIAWTRSLVPDGGVPDGGTGGGFAAAGGVLYVTTGFGEVWALDPRSGGTIWQRTLEAPVRAAPAVADGRVIVVQRDDTAYALDARSGGILWRVQGVGGPGLLGGASPAIEGQLAVVPFASGEVLGVLARNGLTVWGTAVTGGRPQVARNNITDISGDPVIDGEVVYASNQAGRTIRVDARTGERAWTIAEGSYGPAWPAGGSVFLLSDEAALVRADAATGELLWQVQLPELFPHRGFFGRGKPFKAVAYHGPVLAGGRLWVAGADGLLRAFNPANGAPLAELPLPGGAAALPAVAGGIMYIVTQDGKLLAFQ